VGSPRRRLNNSGNRIRRNGPDPDLRAGGGRHRPGLGACASGSGGNPARCSSDTGGWARPKCESYLLQTGKVEPQRITESARGTSSKGSRVYVWLQ
jgi:hypothetical protein